MSFPNYGERALEIIEDKLKGDINYTPDVLNKLLTKDELCFICSTMIVMLNSLDSKE